MPKIYSAVKLPETAVKIIKDQNIELDMHDELTTPEIDVIIDRVKDADGLITGVNVQAPAEVIQANMRKVGAGDSYSMKLSRVYFRLKATIQVKPLMINMPIFNEYENNMDTKTDWCTYEIDTVRGYN